MDNKIKKYWWLLSLMLVFLGLLFIGMVFCKVSPLQRIADISKRISNTNGVTNIEVGQTYKYDGDVYIKFIDKKNYVQFIDNAQYKTNDELNKERREQEYEKFYPQRHFVIGKVKRGDDGYHLIAKNEVIIDFKDVDDIKDGIIFRKSYHPTTNPKRIYLTLAPSLEGYRINHKYVLTRSNLKLPNSIDEFLAKYTYQPEKLD